MDAFRTFTLATPSPSLWHSKSCSAYQRSDNDPQPLRSEAWPEGLTNLHPKDLERVSFANSLFQAVCRFFQMACSLGVLLVTMENLKNSNFWWMKWVVELMQAVPTYSANFQVCMMGVSRDKWTSFLAHFQEITAMSVSCDKSHSHAPWGFARDETGRPSLGNIP